MRRFAPLIGLLALVWISPIGRAEQAGPKPQLQGELVQIAPHIGYILDAQERARFRLFPEVEGFYSAQVLRVGATYRLLLTVYRQGRRFLLTRPFSQQEWEALRRAVYRPATLHQGTTAGRLWIASHAIAYGFWIYGIQLADLLDITSERGQVGTVMLGTGLTFGASFWATARRPVGLPRARLLMAATYAGIYYATIPDLWYPETPSVLEVEREIPIKDRKLRRKRIVQVGRMLAIPAATVLADRLLGSRNPSTADATLTLWGMAAGAYYAWAIPHVLFSQRWTDPTERRVYVGGIAAAIPLGGYWAWRHYRPQRRSAGAAELIRTTSLIGAYIGLAGTRMLGGETVSDDRLYVAGSALGFGLGWALADRLSAREPYSVGRARLMGLGTVAGGLIGAGSLFVLTNADDERAYLAVSALTGSAAYWLLRRLTQPASGEESAR